MTIQQLQHYPLGDGGVKIIDKENFRVYSVYALYGNGGFLLNKKNIPNSIVSPINTLYAPVLYPISCLTREIEVYGERFVPIDRIREKNDLYEFEDGCFVEVDSSGLTTIKTRHSYFSSLPYWIIQLLQSWFINYQGIEAVNPLDLEINPYK
jgi:hypothetical protein